jgi:hypothetical protein
VDLIAFHFEIFPCDFQDTQFVVDKQQGFFLGGAIHALYFRQFRSKLKWQHPVRGEIFVDRPSPVVSGPL